ncbi:MAG: aldo/keto reductase [Pseudomonadota bacterium]
MQFVRLGRTGLQVSRIALGAMGFGSPTWRSWVLDRKKSASILARALEHGINLIDTCDFYSAGESERLLGELLREMNARNAVLIATKLGNPTGKGPNDRGYSRKHIIEAVDASLVRLKTDRIDLLQTHIWDPSTNIEEMVEAFDFVVRQGKVLYVGGTDIPCWQFARAICHARVNRLTQFSTMQHHYNALWREDERELIPYCRAEGIGLLPYSPLARGLLTGAARRLERITERARTDEYANLWYGRPADTTLIERVEKIAERLSVKPAAVALAWVFAKAPEAVPVFGATSLFQVDEAVNAISLVLPDEDVRLIDEAYLPRPGGGHF